MSLRESDDAHKHYQKAMTLAGKMQATYAEDWRKQTALYEKHNIYRSIARALGVGSGDAIGDIGFGGGNFCIAVLREHPDVYLASMERSNAFIRRAGKALAAAGFDGTVVRTETVATQLSGKRLDRTYPAKLAQKRCPDGMLSRANPLCVLQDDVFQAHAFEALLGDRKLDVCTHVFPGSGGMDAYSNHRGRLAEYGKGMQYTNDMRECVAQFATKHVRPGGTYVRVERASDVDVDVTDAKAWDEQNKVQDIHVAREKHTMSSVAQHWDIKDPETVFSLEMGPDHEDLVALAPTEVNTGIHLSQCTINSVIFNVIVHRCVRNEVPYEG